MYTVVTFDLAVVMKAYTIVREKSESFKDIIVRVGRFHLLCSCMGALGKSIRGSGFGEILRMWILCQWFNREGNAWKPLQQSTACPQVGLQGFRKLSAASLQI